MQIMRPSGLTAVAVLMMTLLSVGAFAQNITGSIVGTVTDPTGAAVSGATVTITDDATSGVRTVQTMKTGDFRFLSVPTGRYTIKIENPGFKVYSRDPIEVLVDQTARVDLSLTVGNVNEQVVITAREPILQTETASLGQVIQGKEVTDLPLNGRNVLSLVSLVPGVVPQGGTSGNLTGQNVFSAGNYAIGGGTANQSSTLIDGAPVNILYGNATILIPDQDFVKEFRVQTSNNTAEYGMYTGGVINIATKNGTNSFHGTIYEFVRNTVLNANDWFANFNKTGKQPFHQNQFGANVGGPLWKNKVFFFGDYQGFRQAYGNPYTGTVPTVAELSGDFSAIPGLAIYDPLTTCGYNGNPACVPGQPTRQQFANNIIPASRIAMNPTAAPAINFPNWAKPNRGGDANSNNNFSTFASAGGNNNQFNLRSDQQLGEKYSAFERYTFWKSKNIGADYYNNGLLGGDPTSPEQFTGQQLALGETYLINPTEIADIRLSYTRWNYQRTPGAQGIEPTTLGLPSYFDQIPSLDHISSKSIAFPNYNVSGYPSVSTSLISSIDNNYVLSPTFTKIAGRHAVKFGADLRLLEDTFFQLSHAGGTFSYTNIFTAVDPAHPGSTGNALASFLLGYPASGSVQISPETAASLFYQGYYVSDTWQATQKMTVTMGLRYEIPGTYNERNDWLDTFNPTEINPATAGVTVNGNPVPGAFDLVATANHPGRGMRTQSYNLLAPRLGVAYRLDEKTVIRAGAGRFFIPSDLQFQEGPYAAAVTNVTNNQVTTNNNNETPFNTMVNPFPTGFVGAPLRSSNYQQAVLGGSPTDVLAYEPTGETYQWNLAVQHTFFYGVALEAAYAGLRGIHLPVSVSVDQIPDSYLTQASQDPTCAPTVTPNCFLTKQVTNPFYGKISQGPLINPTVSGNRLLAPYPQYSSLTNPGHYVGISNYNALQMKLEKRFHKGGVVLGSYTFSKVLTNAETLTSWLESNPGGLNFQDNNNIKADYALSSFDARQRLVVSYVYQLPIGRGQSFFAGTPRIANLFISGWGVNGITTFQKGFPLGITDSVNNIGTYALAGTLRPNVVPGVKKTIDGPIQKRLGGKYSPGGTNFFNTAAFSQPATFSYGNESRNDNVLRGPGIANYDFALFKDTTIHENVLFEFRVESFNLFNRVQFGMPNQVFSATTGNTFGQITSDQNTPRLLQIAGRINF
jgi:hypothetical protein